MEVETEKLSIKRLLEDEKTSASAEKVCKF
jgi:hypothetical protein